MIESFIRLLEWLGDKWNEHLSPIIILKCYESGVVLRLGSYHKELKEGVNFKIPIIDEYHKVIKTVDTFHVSAVEVMTLDGKQVSIEPILKFDIVNPKKYIIDTNEAASNFHDIARGIIAYHLSDISWDEIKEKSTLTTIKNKLKSECDEMGVSIIKVYFGRIVTTKVFTVYKE